MIIFTAFVYISCTENMKKLAMEVYETSAIQNIDGSMVVVALNQNEEVKKFNINLGDRSRTISIDQKAIQSIIIVN